MPDFARASWIQARLSSIHRLMTLSSVIGSALLAFYMVTTGVLRHEPMLELAAFAPAAVSGLLLRLRTTERDTSELVLVLVGGLIVIGQKMLDFDVTQAPAIVMLIALAATLTMALKRYLRARFLVPWAVVITVAPGWWSGFDSAGIANGLTALLAFLLLTPLAVAAGNTVAEGERRYADLFRHLPMTVLEQDWNAVEAELEALRRRGITDLPAYLSTHPGEVGRLIHSVVTVDANPWAAKMLGVGSPADLCGPLGADRVTGANWQHFANQLVAVWRGDALYHGQFQTTTKQGEELWVQLSWINRTAGTPNRRGSVIVAATDLTDAKRAEEENANLARLRGDLIDGVGHELRTPLSVVVGLAEQLAASHQTLGDEELDELLVMLSQEAGAVSTIVENLITASLIETRGIRFSRVPFDLVRAAQRASEGTGVRLRIAATDQVTVVGDEVRTHQLLRNLMINCAHFGSRDVTLEVVDGNAVGSISLVSVGGGFDGAMVNHILEDSDGLDGDAITTGFGLSLGVARDLARLMSGALTFASRPGRSAFTLEMQPAAAESACGEAETIAG